jgi:hypothetical protein
MKETMKEQTDWRTVQLFLDQNGVSEVEVEQENHDIRCTCREYSKGRARTCQHTIYVQSEMIDNDGAYPVHLGSTAPDIPWNIMDDAEAFRAFIIKYSVVKVLGE